ILARRGILVSSRGPRGGFQLAVPAERLTLDRIVDLFDTMPRRDCLLGRPRCSDSRPCAAHAQWADVTRRLTAFFTGTTVADLLREEPEPDGPGVVDARPPARRAPPRARSRPATARRASRAP